MDFTRGEFLSPEDTTIHEQRVFTQSLFKFNKALVHSFYASLSSLPKKKRAKIKVVRGAKSRSQRPWVDSIIVIVTPTWISQRVDGGGNGHIIAFRADVLELQRDVDQLKSIDVYFLLMDPIMGDALAKIMVPTSPPIVAPLW
ncbi:hypothetical protein HAX54_037135 [Datura stramonium]|uniref:Uncharacterized protein n=1 Tax=Datura stramonium TaxID=4076 RepID=A0ABS8VJJ4_DATST|nr:hypothetical protein [Datura stramonium]